MAATTKKQTGKATKKPRPKQKLTTWQAALKLKGTGEILDMRAVLK